MGIVVRILIGAYGSASIVMLMIGLLREKSFNIAESLLISVFAYIFMVLVWTAALYRKNK